MSAIIYLYIKTHNKTGLKYFGKTTKNPFTYHGSGKHWKRHIKKHGSDITTEIYYKSHNINDIKNEGIKFSEENNIVESNEWANLIDETGTGGNTAKYFTESTFIKMKETRERNNKKWTQTDESNEKRSIAHKNYWNSSDGDKRRQKRYSGSKKEFQNNLFGPPCPAWVRNNRTKIECPHCGKKGDNGNMKRWHFDNCKLISH